MSEYKIQEVLMDEALAFVRSLPLKAQQKITYNYKKIEQGVMDKELFKNWRTLKFGSFALYSMETAIAYSLFGTQKQKL